MDTTCTPTTATALPPTACDLSRRSVRVLQRRANGLVEFEFSVGWPELVVELALAEPDFQDFCRQHNAAVL